MVQNEQTNKYTSIQTNIQTHTHIYRKTISGNQARTHSQPTAGCGHAPGLKIG